MFFYFSKIVTFFIDPLFLFFVITLISILFSRLRYKIRFGFLILIGLIYLLSTQIVSNQLMGYLENAVNPSPLQGHYDTVVVLSGMAHPEQGGEGGEGGIEFGGAVDRILKGMEMIRDGRANYMILSGGDGSLTQKNPSESVLLKTFAIKMGIPGDRIIVEPGSKNTAENASETAQIIKQYQWGNILLITSAFHMYRANGAFRNAGVEADLLPVDYNAGSSISDFRSFLPSSAALAKSSRVFHEILGIVAYGITGKAKYF